MSDAKKTILSRRARFIAAAVAGLACGRTTVPPVPDAGETLPTPVPVTADTAPSPPVPCLTVVMPDPPPTSDAAPRPCLKPPNRLPPTGKTCDPPFTIDADGRKHYKVECIE
jgi:serine/threonine-protein kinase